VETIGVLTEAAATAQTVWIGYVDNNGGASERLVDPLRVQGGWLTAYDHVRDAVRTSALHRITGVARVAAEEANRG
jgi:predicted DNA-binding transcriptional regulator YafY